MSCPPLFAEMLPTSRSSEQSEIRGTAQTGLRRGVRMTWEIFKFVVFYRHNGKRLRGFETHL
jgi:hypothetical protein